MEKITMDWKILVVPSASPNPFRLLWNCGIWVKPSGLTMACGRDLPTTLTPKWTPLRSSSLRIGGHSVDLALAVVGLKNN